MTEMYDLKKKWNDQLLYWRVETDGAARVKWALLRDIEDDNVQKLWLCVSHGNQSVQQQKDMATREMDSGIV